MVILKINESIIDIVAYIAKAVGMDLAAAPLTKAWMTSMLGVIS